MSISTATQTGQTLEALRLNNHSQISSILSPFLTAYLRSRGVLTLEEFAADGVLDFSNFINEYGKFNSTLNNANGDILFSGYQLLSAAKKLILPTIKTPGGTTITPTTDRFFNLTGWNSLQSISQGNSTAYQAFEGDMRGMIQLTDIYLNFVNTSAIALYNPNNYVNNTQLPILSNNPNLTSVKITGNGLGLLVPISITNLGNLSGLTKLVSYTLQYLLQVSTTNRQIIDNILLTLNQAKTAGAPLTTVDFTGSIAPTAGTNDANYTALRQAGVTVTLGTL